VARVAEICCGSLEDSIIAEKAGADRIELNNAMYLGGLTPSIGTINEVLKNCQIPVVVMVRPRPGGFYYNDYEFNTMLTDIRLIAQYPIKGIVFGCLTESREIDEYKTSKIIDLANQNNLETIFHRAFDCVGNPYRSIEKLIKMGVKRVLTSGLQPKAEAGIEVLVKLQKVYGNDIEILVGSGVNASNCARLIQKTDIKQYHSSCRSWRNDPTTVGNVSYSYAKSPNEEQYEIVSYEKAVEFVKAVKGN